MALARVYCGLASADPEPASAGSTLVAAVVDDIGRLLDVCEVGDNPAGYAKLGSVLAERPGALSSAAVATDNEDYTVVSLLGAAGLPIAVADDDSADDFAERFADDESPQEMTSAPAQRRAVGMARALQAGALSATTLPAPRNLAVYRPVLAAHAALLNGRQAAAAALREVLRELYPAALRAYSDPADALALAVLDALPEPGMISDGRGRRADAVVADLAATGVADRAAITDAVTALKIAVSETPRRGSTPRDVATTTAEAVRQAVAAVRAYDVACRAMVETITAHAVLTESVARPVSAAAAGSETRALPASRQAAREVATDRRRDRARPETTGTDRPATRASGEPRRQDSSTNAALPSEAAPVVSTQRRVSPADAGEPFRPTLTTAVINSARAERQRAMSARSERGSTSQGNGPADYSVSVPINEPTPPGSRANWPLVSPGDDDRAVDRTYADSDRAQPGDDRVTPPWLADDLPEPPMLRLVEPPLSDRTPSGQPGAEEAHPGTRSLRLVETEAGSDWGGPSGSDHAERTGGPPVPEDDDEDLLIFAQTRSAWFTGRPQEANLEWTSSADSGWRAAEQAAQPAVGEMTRAGLPKRVPQANLVPGSPLRDDRPLRIVRDASSIARNTSGYFQGWRRGQEIGGYAVGGRPGRESAGGWDFSRDQEHEDNPEYEYRSARY